MGKYFGNKSLDAEIILSFVMGEVTMDYSLNKFGYPNNSNSVVMNSEWRNQPFSVKIKCMMLDTLLFVGRIFGATAFPMSLFARLTEMKLLKDPKWSYKHQKFLKWYFTNLNGIRQQSHSGELKNLVLMFTIPDNLWVDYELEGEYKEKIKSISLLRNFTVFYRYGRFKEIRQNGWNVVFEFISEPSQGSCVIKYV